MTNTTRLLREYADDVDCLPIAQAMASLPDEALAALARDLGHEPPELDAVMSALRGSDSLEEIAAALARGAATMPVEEIERMRLAIIEDESVRGRAIQLNVLLCQDKWWSLAMARHFLAGGGVVDHKPTLGTLVVTEPGLGERIEGDFEGEVTLWWVDRGSQVGSRASLRVQDASVSGIPRYIPVGRHVIVRRRRHDE